MKHLALRTTSVWNNKPFTTPGLGDRLHSVLVAYNYSIVNKVPVTLHITDDKWNYSRNSRNDMKIRSWNEILELLPPGHVYIQPHEIMDIQEDEWLVYLETKGIDAELWYYSDGYTGPRDVPTNIDAVDYLRVFPCIPPIVDDIELPEKFVTIQFDSNNVSAFDDNSDDIRKIPSFLVKKLMSNLKEKGFDFIFLGGDAEDDRFKVLKNCGYAMSKARYHYGADSGFFHLASYYMKPEQIRIITKGRFRSHHISRASNCGVGVKSI